MNLTNHIVIEKAKELGFDLVGFASADLLEKETDRLKQWLDKGYHSSMDYMARNVEKRYDVKTILPSARSIISLGMNYYTDHHHTNEKNTGKVSRYAWGKDYHLVIWEKLELLEEELKQLDPEFKCLSYVDTGPVMDKSWAVHAGLGWMGKHSNVINKEIGSWIFLATLFANRDFEYNIPTADFCGSCRACIEACPTQAIVDEYIIDANRCISFLTIENKGEISPEFKDKFDNWLFGCDVCQDVCPWNKKFSEKVGHEVFEPTGNKEISLQEILEMEPETFKWRYEVSPIKRAKLSGLKRNAEFLKST
jgi:epoxyqueuosine reductase